MSSWSFQNAKDRLSEGLNWAIHRARGLSRAAYSKLLRRGLRAQAGFREHLLSIPRATSGEDFERIELRRHN